MVQTCNNGCLDKGSFGGGVRKEVRFCTLLKVVLTGIKENSQVCWPEKLER